MLTTDPKKRKEQPIARGVLDYFPDAIAEVANVSYVGNQQHNPGEEMHWAREKSKDHADCIARHLVDRGTRDAEGLRHSAKIAWRALALLQLEIEKDRQTQSSNEETVCGRERCGYNPPTSGYAGCTRERGHAGPCAHDFSKDAAGDAARAYVEGQTVVTESLTKPKPLCYISGPMRGLPEDNFPAFDAAKRVMERHGYEVISPADLDRELGTTEDICVYAERDMAALIRVRRGPPGGICVRLVGWEESKGGRAELSTCEWIGVPVHSIREFA